MGIGVNKFAPISATSNAFNSGIAGVKNKVNQVADYMVPPDAVVVKQDKTLYPMSKGAASFTGKFAKFFSYATVKKFAPISIAAGLGIAGGSALAIFAGPAIHGAFMAMAASSVFPPVMIAIGATLGAALLAFGLYKLVQNAKKKAADQELYKSAVAGQNIQPSVQNPEAKSSYASGAKSTKSAKAPEAKSGSMLKKSEKSASVKTMSSASQKTIGESIPAYEAPAPVLGPQIANESAEWAK